MTAPRSRAETKYYNRYRREHPGNTAGCDFCVLTSSSDQFVDQTTHFWIIRALVPYSLWDEHDVSHHLLVVPKQHTETLSDLSDEATLEFARILQKYEHERYNIYARAPQSAVKTVPHQHTHLLKSAGKRKRFLLYITKPYLRLTH